MKAVSPAVELLSCTPKGEELIALAAKLCYAGGDLRALMEGVQLKDQQAFLAKILSLGHWSVLEHVSFTFAVEGVSRSLLAQITRHRIASFSVQSQRYVSMEEGFDYIIPPSIQALGPEKADEFAEQMKLMHKWYLQWQALLGKGETANEDARFVLPNACATRLIITMNARELLHFFKLRCCERAQWEIRGLAIQMLKICKQTLPVIFEKAGPGCVSGPCPEGNKSCGRSSEIKEKFKQL